MRLRMVGREVELGQLVAGLVAAQGGRGSLALVTGEAGIGKTRLLEALTDTPEAHGVAVYWGRCWEGGGAPSFWPWIQVLREVLDASPDTAEQVARGPRAALLSSLLPERFSGTGPEGAAPEQERFVLFDAIAGILRAAAATTPLLVLLEDLHMADLASVALLDFLATQLDRAPVMIVGTYRAQAAARSPVGVPLAKTGRRAERMVLGRLGPGDVEAMLDGRDAETVRRVYEASEGNPLFVVEVSELLGRSPAGADVPLSEGIRSIIVEHLATVRPSTAELLRSASVLGRDLDVPAVSALTGREMLQTTDDLAQAVDAGLVVSTGFQTYRFSHFMIREVLHANLEPPVRAALHRRAADRLAGQARPRWAELLMHYRNAGPSARPLAHEAARKAGDHAMTQLATTDAADYYGQALELLTGNDRDSDVARVEILLLRGHAQLIAGDHAGGKASCTEAAEISRRIDRADLLARAALELGGIFIIGNVDATMVQLLEEALDRLGDAPSALRAMVMARYAAAKQPAPDLAEPVRIARDAIDMARGLDDPEALLGTIRSGMSAMMDVWDPALRRPLNEEHVALATQLNQRTEILRGHQRLALDTLELGDMVAHRASIRAAERIAQGLDHPYFRWRVAALLAGEATASGRFEEAAVHRERAERLAEEACDPAASLTLAMNAVGLALVREDDERVLASLPAMLDEFRAVQLDSAFGTLIVAGALARLEHSDDPRVFVDERDLQVALEFRDVGSLLMVAEVASLTRDADLAGRVAEALVAAPQRLISWGSVGATCDGPVARARGLVAAAQGETVAAERALRAALQTAEGAGLGPHRARILYDLARLTSEVTYAQAARRSATALGMTGLLARIDRRFDAGAPATSTIRPRAEAPRLAMRLEAGVWQVETASTTFHLKRTKGADMLAALIETPGQAHHVLDLMTGGQRAAVDAGHAGALLDDGARAAYRERLASIDAELTEAQSWADRGRVERLEAEKEALTAELSRAFGLGGRKRTGGGASERARVNVQRRLKDAIKRIAAHDPDVGKWLERSVVTGTYCRFDPP